MNGAFDIWTDFRANRNLHRVVELSGITRGIE